VKLEIEKERCRESRSSIPKFPPREREREQRRETRPPYVQAEQTNQKHLFLLFVWLFILCLFEKEGNHERQRMKRQSKNNKRRERCEIRNRKREMQGESLLHTEVSS
jgi:hypothetical protein